MSCNPDKREPSQKGTIMNASIMISAIAPVIFIIALGYCAGRNKDFDAHQTKGFSRLALRYALCVTCGFVSWHGTI